MNAGAKPIPGQHEKALLEYLERLGKSAAGRHALHVKFSRLRTQNRHPQRLHIAALAFEPLINNYEGHLFRLHNGDFVIVCTGASEKAMTDAAERVASLFEGDPGAKTDPNPDTSFWQHFDLANAHARMLALGQELLELAKNSVQAQNTAGQAAKADIDQRPLDPGVLGKIQSAIAQADLTNVIRRQAVCAVLPGMPPQPVFTEVFTSMAVLRDALTPDIDIAGNPWLFRDLTAHLDRRVISFLGHKDDSSLSKAFSINLNVASLTSQEFLAFDQALSSEARETVVIELQLIDVLADIDIFQFARNFLRERKYRFCLDGLTHQTLPFINCPRLGVDLVKIIWNSDLHALAVAKDPELMAAVKAIDPKRIILIRCDDKTALETGKLLGSSLYQGYLIDGLLKKAPEKAAAKTASA